MSMKRCGQDEVWTELLPGPQSWHGLSRTLRGATKRVPKLGLKCETRHTLALSHVRVVGPIRAGLDEFDEHAPGVFGVGEVDQAAAGADLGLGIQDSHAVGAQ